MKGPKPGRRCCTCRVGLFEARHFLEFDWLPRRGRYYKAICFGCFNKLWMRSNARAGLPIVNELAKPARPRAMVRRRNESAG